MEEDALAVESLPSLDRSTLRERTMQALRAAIVTGRYRPGDQLGEADLAAHLGVSRGTVRQALRHLQHEGLVTTGHRSMRVNSLTPVEVRELFRVRASLEGLAVGLVISSPDRGAAVESLRSALTRFDDARADFTGLVDADLAFHLLLCRLSGNSVLVDTWRHLEGRVRVVTVAAGPIRAQPMMSPERHAPIVDAIEAGDHAAGAAAVTGFMTAAADHFAVRPQRRS